MWKKILVWVAKKLITAAAEDIKKPPATGKKTPSTAPD